MSMDVDSRIVEMQFRNSEFEKNVKETTGTLEKLKKTLDFRDIADKGFEHLRDLGNSLQLTKIADGLETITNRFSLLGQIGERVLSGIADKAYYAGKNLVTSLSVDQVSAGWGKYNEKTASVQTIVAATGKPIEEVNEALEELMWFTDETSYNFVDMTNNIGKFTSMNVPLNTAVDAMQGIANWAAVSGQNASAASRVMYNLSQAIGVGSVKLMDWRSIENANMATTEFKQTVIDTAKELGVLDSKGRTKGKTNKKGEYIPGELVTTENFANTLALGWFDKDVLLKTLGKYNSFTKKVKKLVDEEGISASEAIERLSGDTQTLGEKAFKAAQEAKTLQDAIDATKDAVSSGWMQTFEYIFGNYEEAKVLWTDLANDLWEIFASGSEARNELLKEWHEKGGRDNLITGLSDSMDALLSVISTVKDAFHAVFPQTTVDDLLNISNAVKDFGANLKETFNREEFDDGLGTKYSGPLLKIKLIFEGLFSAIKSVGSALSWIWKVAKEVFSVFSPFGKVIEKIVEAGYTFFNDLAYAFERFQKPFEKGIVSKLPAKLAPIKTFFETISEKILDFFHINKDFDEGDFFGPLDTFFNKILGLGKYLKVVDPLHERLSELMTTEGLSSGEAMARIASETIDEKSIVEVIKEKIVNIVKGVGAWISSLFPKVTSGDIAFAKAENFGTAGISAGIAVLVGLLSKKFVQIVSSIVSISHQVKKTSKGIRGLVETVKEKIDFFAPRKGETAASLADRIAEVSKKFGLALIEIAASILIVAAAIWIVGQVPVEKIGIAIGTIAGIFVILGASFALFAYAIKKEWISNDIIESFSNAAEAFIKIGAALLIFSSSVLMLSSMTTGGLIRGGVAVIALLGSLVLVLFAISKFKLDGELLENVGEFVNKLANSIRTLTICIQVLSSIDWESLVKGLIAVISLGVGLVAAVKFIGTVKVNPSAIFALITIAVAIGALSAVFVITTLLMKAVSWADLAKSMVSMAFVIAALVGVLVIIGNLRLSPLKLIKNLYAMTAVTAVIAVAMAGFTAMALALSVVSWGTLIKSFVSIIAVVGGMFLLLDYLNAAPSIQWQNILPTLGAMIAIAATLDLVIVGFIALVLAMKLVSFADIVKALVSVAGIVAILIGTLKVIELAKPVIGIKMVGAILSLIAIAVALDLAIAGFVVLAVALKGLSFGDIIKAIVAFAAVAAVLVGACLLLGYAGKAISIGAILALIPVAVALDLLVLGFVALAITMRFVSWEDLAKAIGSLGSCVAAMVATLYFMKGISLKDSFTALISAISLAGLMLLFAVAVNMIKDVNLDVILGVGAAISAMLTSFGFLLVMSKIGGITGIGLAMLAVVALVNTIIACIAEIAALLNAPGVSIFMNSAAEKLGSIIGTFKGVTKAAEAKAFAKGIAGISEVGDADQKKLSVAMKCATMFGDFANNLPKRNVFEKAADFFFGNDMVNFCRGMESFAKSFGKMSETIEKAKIKTSSEKKMNAMINISSKLADLDKKLPKRGFWGKLGDKLAGSDMETFVNDMGMFALGISGFAIMMKRIPKSIDLYDIDWKTYYATNIASRISYVIKNLPNYSKMGGVDDVSGWFVSRDMKIFTGDMALFAVAISNFAKFIDKIDFGKSRHNGGETQLEEKVTKCVIIATRISQFIKDLPPYTNFEKSVIGGWLTNTNMDLFAEDMSTFANAINGFSKLMMDVDFGLVYSNGDTQLEKKTTKSVTIATRLSEFIKGLKDLGYNIFEKSKLTSWLTNTDMDLFAEDMSTFANAINGFSKLMMDVDLGLVYSNGDTQLEKKTTKSVTIATRLSKFIEGLKELDYNIFEKSKLTSWLTNTDMDLFAEDMSTFANAINGYSKMMSKVSFGLIYSNGDTQLEKKTLKSIAIAGSISKFVTDLPEYSIFEKAKVLDWLTSTDLEVFSGDLTTFAEGVNNFSTLMADVKVDDDLDAATTIAVDIATKVANFIGSLADVKIERDHANHLSDFDMYDDTGTVQGTVFNAISRLALSMQSAQTNLKGLSGDESSFEEDIKVAMDAATRVAGFISYLTDLNIENAKGPLQKFFEGDTVQDTVFGAVGQIAKTMSDSKDNLASINGTTIKEDVRTVVATAKYVAGLLHSLKNTFDIPDFWDADDYGKRSYDSLMLFTDDLISKFSSFVTTIGSSSDLRNCSNLIYGVSSIIKQLLEMYNTSVDTSALLAMFDPSALATSIAEFVESVNSTLEGKAGKSDDYLKEFDQTGSILIGALTSAMQNGDVSWVEGFLNSIITPLNDAKGRFESSGKSFLEGINTGLHNGERYNWIMSRISEIGNAMLSTLDYSLDVNSPSKEAAKRGVLFGEGLANGISSVNGLVVDSVERTGSSMLNAANNGVAGLSSLLSSSIDERPVIRPVVDLSDIEYANGIIASMFNGNDFAIRAKAIVGSVRNGTTSGPVSNQNGSSDIVNAIHDMNSRIDNLGIAIQNMQMVVDSGALVGHIAPAMDKRLGVMAAMKGRMG